MTKDRQEEAQPKQENKGSLRLNVHVALGNRSPEPRNPADQAELRRKREERVKQRLTKLLRRRYPSSRIPALLTEFEEKTTSLEELEERVRLLETIPSVIWGLDRRMQEAAAQVRPLLEAATELSRVAPHLQDVAEQVRSFQAAQEQVGGIEPQVKEMIAAADIERLQPVLERVAVAKDFDSIAAKNLGSIAAKSLGSVAAKSVDSIAAKNLGSLAAKECALCEVSENDAVKAAMEYIEGSTAMSRSIFGDLSGYNSAVREIERALDSRREFERALGLGREAHQLFEQNDYRRALGLDSADMRTMRELSASRELLDAAFRPLPDLDRLLGVPGAGSRRANASGAYRRLSRAISNAPVLGKAEVKKEKVDAESKEAPEASQELETNLVKVVPAEVLTQIRLPLSELHRVLRHPEAMRQLSARDFEKFIATLVEQLGFDNVFLTPSSGDKGRDVLATKKVSGIPIIFAFECKRYAPDHPVGPETARALLGTIMHGPTRASMGVLVTTSTFTPAAREFILTEPVLDGKDFDGVLEWLKECRLS